MVRADMADAEAVRAMVDEAAEQARRARRAGQQRRDLPATHPVTGTSYEEWQDAWQATLGVNLAGAANATWCAVRHMNAADAAGGS